MTDWKGLKAAKIDEDENESRGRFLEVVKERKEQERRRER
jgi:hypothetical protein